MSTIQPIHAYSSKVSVNDGASNAQQVFESLGSANFPFGDVAIHKFANLNSGDRNLVKTVGMIDDGQLSIEMLYNKTDYARLVALKGIKYITGTTPTIWVVTGPPGDGTSDTADTVTTNGILTKCEVPLADNYTTMKLTVECWGGFTVV